MRMQRLKRPCDLTTRELAWRTVVVVIALLVVFLYLVATTPPGLW